MAELLTTTDGPLYQWVAAPLERDSRVLCDVVNSFVEEAEHRLAERRPSSLGSVLDDPNFQYFVLSV